MLPYAPREQFLPFHNRSQRWAVLNTHRRAGKTVALVNDLILDARQQLLPRPQYAYVGPTFTQSKRVSWQYLKDYSLPFLQKPPSESELKITLQNDAVIYCLGADNPDSLRGMYLDGAVLDEYALFRPSVFSQIIRPALSDRMGWGVFASTPRGRNLFHEVFRKAQLNPSEYHITNLSALTSNILPDQELAELRKDLDKEEFAQEYLCSFDSALKGAIYADEVNTLFSEQRAYNFEGDPLAPLYDPLLPTNFVYDLGFTDATVRIAWQVNKHGQIIIVNVEATTGQDIDYHISSLHSFADAARLEGGGVGEVWLPHDARAKNLQTGKSILEQFALAGISPRIVPNHKVRDRIAATRKVFPTITIDCTPASPDVPDLSVTGDLLEALKAYRREWDEEKQIFSEQPIHDWASDFADAFGYMCVVASPHVLIQDYSRADDDLRGHLQSLPGHQIYLPGYNLDTLHLEREAHLNRIASRIQ